MSNFVHRCSTVKRHEAQTLTADFRAIEVIEKTGVYGLIHSLDATQ